MPRLVKFVGLALTALAVIVVVAGIGLVMWTNGELAATVPNPAHAFVAATGDSAVARGEHVTKALAKCGDCHGDDFGGKTMIDDPAMGRIGAPNLTTGRGGVLAAMGDADLERAIRHGVAGDGRRLVLMPSNEYQLMSDDDLSAVIAYLRTVPPVDREVPAIALGPLARVLYAAGKMPWFPSDLVTHRAEVVAAVPVDSTVEYGRYLANGGCSGCHGANYSGGAIPGAPPDWPKASDISPTGLRARGYDYGGFVRALTEGVRPDGSAIHPVMPVQATKLMTQVEMRALWKYLEGVDPVDAGTR